MWPTPASRSSRASAVVTSTSPRRILPPVGRRVPASTSTSSLCPLPSTPAIPRISPCRSSNEMPRRAGTPRSEFAVKFSTRNVTAPGVAGFLSTRSSTSRPTIIVAISCSLVSLVIRWPTTLPRRITVMRSEISRTSLSLWLMKTMVLPSWIKREAVLARQRLDVFARSPIVVEPEPDHRLAPEHDVFAYREDRDEHEMLVHHPDAKGDGIARTADARGLAVDDDLP